MTCKKCGHIGATNEFRRSPKGGSICRDKESCGHDQRARLAGEKPGPRSLQSLLRW